MRNIAILTVWMVLVSAAMAGKTAPEPYRGSAEFERLKTLAGVWEGKMDMGQGPAPVRVEYRVVAGGSALEERIFAGTPQEMVTLYYDQQGKLALTHYCMLHNRPAMRLKSARKNELVFDFDAACGIQVKSETHMHALTLTWQDADTITYDWTMFKNGQAQAPHPFTVKRVKS